MGSEIPKNHDLVGCFLETCCKFFGEKLPIPQPTSTGDRRISEASTVGKRVFHMFRYVEVIVDRPSF